MTDVSTKRLNKYISETGFCSRREADKHIQSGAVTINGQHADVGSQVAPGDIVKVNGKALQAKQQAVYIAYHKPVGITCTTERHVKGNIIDAINHPLRIFPIGRLDKPSEGLIFLTSDGDIVNKILRAGNQHEKEYIVTVDKPITDEFIRRMGQGVPILDTITQRCKVFKQSRYVFNITLTQGLNRQIRRMCEYLGFEVTKLKRVRIMNINLDRLAKGQWRELTTEEMATINQMVAGSSGTEQASTQVSKTQQARAKRISGSASKGQNSQRAGGKHGNKSANGGKPRHHSHSGKSAKGSQQTSGKAPVSKGRKSKPQGSKKSGVSPKARPTGTLSLKK